MSTLVHILTKIIAWVLLKKKIFSVQIISASVSIRIWIVQTSQLSNGISHEPVLTRPLEKNLFFTKRCKFRHFSIYYNISKNVEMYSYSYTYRAKAIIPPFYILIPGLVVIELSRNYGFLCFLYNLIELFIQYSI